MTSAMEVDSAPPQEPSSSSSSLLDYKRNESDFMPTLCEPLRGYALRAFAPPPPPPSDGETDAASSTPEAAAAAAATAKRLDELEIATRSHLLELVEQLVSSPSSTNNGTTTTATIETLLQYLKQVTLLCLHVVHHHSSTADNDATNNNASSKAYYSHLTTTALLKKLPFLLLEDTIDSLPLLHIQTLWSSPSYPTLCISSYTTTLLCSPLIFVLGSKFVLLRICNKLLKVLSNRDVDANFAGSVMMMMTKVFPLSERSAVNVLGSFNVVNETLFEDEEEFETKANAAGNVGSGSSSASSSNTTTTIGYEFYKTFWGVQKVFTDPQGTILASRGGPTQAQAASAYSGFVRDVTSILVALESTPVPKTCGKSSGLTTTMTANSSSSSSHNGDDNNDDNNMVHHHKYLTSSQLLHLQLKDPTLRIHFLTQLLIVLSYLRSSPAVPLPAPPITPAPGADPAKLLAQIRATQTKQLVDTERRTVGLLKSTPGGGEAMVRSLTWLFGERESIWRNWKRSKCLPALDKVGGSAISMGDVTSKLLVVGKRGVKRKAPSSSSGGGSRFSKKTTKESIATTPTTQRLDALPKITVPPLTSFLDPYVEALDPENGIEGEYHPRNDKVYCWRALRLMARDFGRTKEEDDDGEATAGEAAEEAVAESAVAGGGGEGQLRRFAKLRRRDGDFEGIVRDMWKEDKGEEIGGVLPEDYYQEVVEEISAVATAKEETKDDEIMDDDAASVGSTQEDAQAKKEKMAEFEKMAMEVEEEMLNDESAKEEEDDAGGATENKFKKEEGDGTTRTTTSSAKVKEEADSKDGSCPIHDAAAETIESMFHDEPKMNIVATESKKVEPKKGGTAVKSESESSKSNGSGTKNSVAPRGKEKATTSTTANETRNGGKKDEKALAGASTNSKDKKTAASSLDTSNGNKPSASSPQMVSRAKFTPPQKVQQQQQQQAKNESRNESRDYNRGGRFVKRGSGRDGRSGSSERQPQQSQPPSDGRSRDTDRNRDNSRGSGRDNSRIQPLETRRDDRDSRQTSSHHGKDNGGRDSGKRDGGGGGGSSMNASNVGKGNDSGGGGDNNRRGNTDGNAASRGGGAGRGGNSNWEPPSHSGGGGGGRGSGRGGRGGGRGGYRRTGGRRRN